MTKKKKKRQGRKQEGLLHLALSQDRPEGGGGEEDMEEMKKRQSQTDMEKRRLGGLDALRKHSAARSSADHSMQSNREAGCCLQLSREAELVQTDKQGPRVAGVTGPRRQG